MSPVLSAAIYVRISSDPTGAALGVTRQLQDCRKLAADRGWTVAEEYVDNDISAFSGKRRPGYDQMVEDIRDRARDAVIVYNLDRLTRRPIELEEFAEVCHGAGVRELATVTADIDLGNDDGLFMARLYAAVAAKESGRKSKRVLRKMQENAEAGRPHGGPRAFGYEPDKVTIREPEAAVIRQVVDRYLAGESTRSLATWLQETGVPSVSGKPWRTTTVRAILASPRMAGLREHQGVTLGPAAWPAIITHEQHRRAVALMQQKSTAGKRSPRRYLLSGLLRCGRCGRTLFSSARGNTRRYVCLSGPDHGGCGRLTIVAEPVELLVAAGVLHRLDTPALADALAGRAEKDEALSRLNVDMVQDQAQLSELAAAYGAKLITMREWLNAKQLIDSRIESAAKRISRATHTDALRGLPGNGQALRDSWDTLNLTRQAAIVTAVLDHAVIGPGTAGARSLDPARVRPVWKL